jgi:hypothetical protein
MEKRPQDRYPSAAELAADLRRHLANEPILAKPPGAVTRGVKWVRRHPAVSAAAAVGLLALVVVSGLAVSNARLAEANAEQTRIAEANAEEARAAERGSELRRKSMWAILQGLLVERRRGEALLGKHPDPSISITIEGSLPPGWGELAEAGPFLGAALEVIRRKLRDEHHITAHVLRAQFLLLRELERPDEARTLLTDFLATSSLPEDHPLRSEVRGLLEAADGSGGSEEGAGEAKDGD